MLYIHPEEHAPIEVHPAHRQIHIKPVSQPLYVACAISNPERYYARYKHYHAFAKHMEDSGAILYTVELALRDRHFEITSPSNPHHIQVRSPSTLWAKEALLNIGISRFPPDWHYGAWLDADFLMTRPDWVTETIHQLQHYRWVQLFSTFGDLDSKNQLYHTMPGYVFGLKTIGPLPKGYGYGGSHIGAPGGGWAFRRSAFFGLLDTCVLGSADWHMATGLSCLPDTHPEVRHGVSPGYVASIRNWTTHAVALKANIGYIDNFALHYWHGPKSARQYGTRWKILKQFQFDPATDLRRDWQGMIEWAGNKPDLEEEVRQYFRLRAEDHP